ncbi:hypothetical protein LTR85_000925 [Meristemomyces frigidus]|nr:hypothetical protein LTR85_000925 [Meristemomyces frigidus]
MPRASRRHIVFSVASVAFVLLLTYTQAKSLRRQDVYTLRSTGRNGVCNCDNGTTEHYPVLSFQSVPPPGRRKLPRIQHRFSKNTAPQEDRREVVKQAFLRCWDAYREHAWLTDELMPLGGRGKDHFGGWAATLVDALDTLWIMDLKEQFWEAVEVAVTIDFSMPATDETGISIFETTIRYLGGLLAAYDLCGDIRLLYKAAELGDALYGAFDTPNRMPISYWDMTRATDGRKQIAKFQASLADIGSLTLEFTRLSQLTKDRKYYDAIARIMDAFAKQQNATDMPGMWPQMVDPNRMDFHTGSAFPIGAMADSMYEYLPKMAFLLHGSDMYERMYSTAVDAIVENVLFRPMVPDEADILMAGKVHTFLGQRPGLELSVEHLGCFAGGMLALGGRLLENDAHIDSTRDLARRLHDGAVRQRDLVRVKRDTLARGHQKHNITLPNSPGVVGNINGNAVSDELKLPVGMTSVTNKHYILRPEAIESIFILYRITGDTALQDAAWSMFESIQNATRTHIANAALSDVTDLAAPKMDEMESFWLSETLKYFYLIFSEPDLISLDEYVFNTEAHPLRRLQRGFWGFGWG